MSIYVKTSQSADLLDSASDILAKILKLTYSSSTLLVGTLSGIPSRYNSGVAIATMLRASGSPYNQVSALTVSEISNSSLSVYANGTGFVSGHVLQVGLLLAH